MRESQPAAVSVPDRARVVVGLVWPVGLRAGGLGRRLRRAGGLVVVVCVLCAGVLGAAAGSAAAAGGSGYFVTFVARACPSYADIFANRARNDILESLMDLGPDTQYGTSGRMINPVDEAKPPQNLCTPLVGWQFTLGTGYQSHAVTGVWGSLSIVTNPYGGAPIVTQASTPLLNQNAVPVGHVQLPGATTVELTDAERQQASNASSLWAQGGTPSDPVLAAKFPGPQYAFGALRCATDNLNGDNVEFLFFPAGVKHVFCYAFYVNPAPTSGLITIQKRVSGAPAGEHPAFPFSGNISYDPNGFQLSDGGSADFYRAGGDTWNVTEGHAAGYRLAALHCTATSASGAPGTSTDDVSGSTASIHLVAGDHVTCVYTNEYVPPTVLPTLGGLYLRKITTGGVGRFGYVVTPPSGKPVSAQATTSQPNVPVAAAPSLTALAPGSYTIREQRTPSNRGHWSLVSVRCNGLAESTTKPVTVVIHAAEATTCTFINAFVPSGSISIAKTTQGGTGTANFLISSRTGTPVQYRQRATTTASGSPADAKPVAAADATDHLALGSYAITEELPPSALANGWTLLTVVCNGQLVPFAQGTAQVNLTPRQQHAHCTYTDALSAKPPPPPPPPPTPPTGNPDQPALAIADLVITKHASAASVSRGGLVSYRITVHNRGPDPAQRVIVADLPRGQTTVVSIHNPAGPCRTTFPIICRLGTINAGATVTITIQLAIDTDQSSLVNQAVVGSATHESTLANNAAHATVAVHTPPPPPPGRG